MYLPEYVGYGYFELCHQIVVAHIALFHSITYFELIFQLLPFFGFRTPLFSFPKISEIFQWPLHSSQRNLCWRHVRTAPNYIVSWLKTHCEGHRFWCRQSQGHKGALQHLLMHLTMLMNFQPLCKFSWTWNCLFHSKPISPIFLFTLDSFPTSAHSPRWCSS